jgi:hypothetical protein
MSLRRSVENTPVRRWRSDGSDPQGASAAGASARTCERTPERLPVRGVRKRQRFVLNVSREPIRVFTIGQETLGFLPRNANEIFWEGLVYTT